MCTIKQTKFYTVHGEEYNVYTYNIIIVYIGPLSTLLKKKLRIKIGLWYGNMEDLLFLLHRTLLIC